MLSRLTKFREEREGGFTLVELLVVIIIIGILAAIAIPVFLNQRQRANDAAVQSAVKSYVNAAESFLVANPNATTFATTSPAATALANLESEGARKSTDVTVTVNGGTNRYVICGSHSNGKAYQTGTGLYVFDSAAGTYSTAATCPTV